MEKFLQIVRSLLGNIPKILNENFKENSKKFSRKFKETKKLMKFKDKF